MTCTSENHEVSSWLLKEEAEQVLETGRMLANADLEEGRANVDLEDMTPMELVAYLQTKGWVLNVTAQSQRPPPVHVKSAKPKIIWAKMGNKGISRMYLRALAKIKDVKREVVEHWRVDSYYSQIFKLDTLVIGADLGDIDVCIPQLVSSKMSAANV